MKLQVCKKKHVCPYCKRLKKGNIKCIKHKRWFPHFKCTPPDRVIICSGELGYDIFHQ